MARGRGTGKRTRTVGTRKLESAFRNKGFRLHNSHHRMWRFYTVDGKRTRIKTKTSHGGRAGDEVGAHIISSICRNLHLTHEQFAELVECSLGHEELEVILRPYSS